MNKHHRKIEYFPAMLSAVLTLALVASMTPQAEAATITVDVGGHCTLADAITSANKDQATGNCPAGSGADLITLQRDVTLNANLPYVKSEVTIDGNGYTISGNNTRRVIFNYEGNLTLRDTTISGGKVNSVGAGILNYHGSLTIINCTVSGNFAERGGGGIYNGAITKSASLVIIDSIISTNKATLEGGGVRSNCYGLVDGVKAEVTIRNSVISGNRSTGKGGGISARSYTVGVSPAKTTFTIIDSTISQNISSSSGGGIAVFGQGVTASVIMTLTDSTISGNKAAAYGGGIENYGKEGIAALSLSGCTISGNIAGASGGGVENFASRAYGTAAATLINTTISGNSVTAGDGGGLSNGDSNYAAAPLVIRGCTISGNRAKNGGGIFNHRTNLNAELTIRGNLISGNQATSKGSELLNNIISNLVLGGYNLLGHNGQNSDASFERVIFQNSDFKATSDSGHPFALNSILGSLGPNGGPTQTHSLPSESPALDLAPKAECSAAPFNKDQRGLVRPYGAGCDAGSYEYKSNLLLMVVPMISGSRQN